MAGVIGRAAGDHHQTVEFCEIRRAFGHLHGIAPRGLVMRQRVTQNRGLFMNLLGHEMPVIAFIHAHLVHIHHPHFAVGQAAFGIVNRHTGTA